MYVGGSIKDLPTSKVLDIGIGNSRRQVELEVRGMRALSVDRRGGGFKFERSRVWKAAD